MVAREIHTLIAGDQFSFTENGKILEVDPEAHLIDLYGQMLVMYHNGSALFSHTCDHTIVWIAI